MKACVLFPGQGFQKFGMLSKLAKFNSAVVKSVLWQCDEVLPQLQLPRLLLGEGQPMEITSTEIAQPLLLAHGMAHFQVWEQLPSKNVVLFGAGHSLGEYTAFVAAGLLTLQDGLKLVHARGEAMKKAASEYPDPLGMTSVMKPKQLSSESWHSLLRKIAKLQGVDISAYNSPAVSVLSGRKEGIEKTLVLLKGEESIKGRVVAMPLPVSAAFHSKYMQSASENLKKLVHQPIWRPLETAKFKIISNVTGKPYESIKEIQECCVAALTSPVFWQQSMEFATQQHVTEFIAMGADIQRLMEKHLRAHSTVFI